MALTFNLPSQIVVQTAAQWAVDATVYSNKRILVTSDVYYGSTDQRKFKVADGVQTWTNLDYMPIAQTLAQVLANGSNTNGVSLKSNDNLTEFLVTNNNIDSYVDNGSDVSEINMTPTTIAISTTGSSIDLSATSVTKNSVEIATVNDIVPVNTSTIGSAINGASSATPNDTDLVMSVESSVAKKNTWTQVKAFLKTYFDTIYATAAALSGKEDTSNKSSSYTLSSTTTYANTKALVDGLATKLTKCHTLNMAHSSLNPADSTSYFFAANAASASTSTNALRRKPAGITGHIHSVAMHITIATSLGSSETATFKINNVTQGTSVTVSTGLVYTATGLSLQWDLASPFAVTKGDQIECQVDMPAFATNPVAVIHYVDLLIYGF
jgi:hypothetical protein